MDYYKFCFGALAALCGVLLVSQPTRRQRVEEKRQNNELQQQTRDDEHPETEWYKAYSLVVAADWLQGPYFFSLLRDEYGLDNGLVLSLYLTDLVSTALSACLIGALADKYGRKLFCMLYCLAYALSCLFTVVPAVPLLFLGRVLGGVSTSILFTVFDSWMVTNFHAMKLAEQGCDLTRTYAATGVVNSFVAILSGMLGEGLVRATGTRKSPCLISVVILWLALQQIWSRWAENFGVEAGLKSPPSSSTQSRSTWSILRQPYIIVLGLITTMFEGSMKLFVSGWIPTLSSAHKSTSGNQQFHSAAVSDLPYRTIFSSFKAASMAGTLGYNLIMHRRILKYSGLLICVFLVANLCFIKLAAGSSTTADSETAAFWLFCLLEACAGMYGPCVGYLKAHLVTDRARTSVYSLMRLPLDVLVIVSLLTTKDSDNVAGVFGFCSLMLTMALATTWVASLRGMP
ncbi:DUF791-domain-containing protein [Xylariaceae sp. FL0594]|nr:DUF791-domain-containing protein [Xylariaceae sp. FL0594]